MIRKYPLFIAAVALLVMTASGSRDESVSGLPSAAATPDSQGTVEFTCTGNKVAFNATAESIAVDWGDGSTEEYGTLDDDKVWHEYANETERIIRIRTGNLSFFSCYSQQVTDLDVSNCPALTELRCYGNLLSRLDVSKNTALTRLYCGRNQLSSLNVSSNTMLERLDCEYNQLGVLNVSNNMALTVLLCNNNRLKALDVSNNTALTSLYCSYNQLSADILDRIFKDLCERSGKSYGEIYIGGNPGSSECHRSIARDKNWFIPN
ncbi:MAG: hypothetical protein LBH72_06990 [Proteiniphilum sp.]|jgi:Leucine-rich repeat (LRR) protein|nr:hypothetical protein [Proteiniphilum sp.]